MADVSLDSRSVKADLTKMPGHQNIKPKTALDYVLTADPEASIPYIGREDHSASFDLSKIIHDPTKHVDAQIIECDRSGKYWF